MAKNTGKTVALTVLVDELSARGCAIGITSIGRDGEACDVLDETILKPRIHLPAGALVATTRSLLKRSGLRHDELVATPYRNPLGTVTIARMAEAGVVEVAGPSVVAQMKAVIERMLALGAEKVIVDGSINRRCASSPDVTDAVIVATGAILGEDLDAVVRYTVEEIRRLRLPVTPADGVGHGSSDHLVTVAGKRIALPPGFGLTDRTDALKQWRAEHGPFARILLRGAVCEAFLDSVLRACEDDADVRVVATDSSKFYFNRNGVGWYEKRGLHLCVLRDTRLCAITVNPVAPQLRSFDSGAFVARLAAAVPPVAVHDVLHASYPRVAASGHRPAPAFAQDR
ncbi:hypothetical protein BZL54_18970 [Burkholderia ubonensis subsp. mesacidophila]|uniref:Uncharacterized protein n=1 Tax=Burkholderia ubonensis subsp. mesacidophila TaxID=265293 RepID=A0A2A4FAM3_9BURK|nr:hypothetical protein BZL54_18970 [Burkholderia ubonensis subsp. mesacidophila]